MRITKSLLFLLFVGTGFVYSELIPESELVGCIIQQPLIQTHWNQSTPHSDFAPVYPGDSNNKWAAPIGCVATATAQILNYYRWPEFMDSDFSYTDTADEIGGNDVLFNQRYLIDLRVPFDYDSIRKIYGGNPDVVVDYQDKDPQIFKLSHSEKERQAAGRLNLLAAIASSMNFEPQYSATINELPFGQGANNTTMKSSNLYVAKSITYTSTLTQDHINEIKSEICSGHPLLMSMPAHAIVGDGWAEKNGEYYIHYEMGLYADSTSGGTSQVQSGGWYKLSLGAQGGSEFENVRGYVAGIRPAPRVIMEAIAGTAPTSPIPVRWAFPTCYTATLTHFTIDAYEFGNAPFYSTNVAPEKREFEIPATVLQGKDAFSVRVTPVFNDGTDGVEAEEFTWHNFEDLAPEIEAPLFMVCSPGASASIPLHIINGEENDVTLSVNTSRPDLLQDSDFEFELTSTTGSLKVNLPATIPDGTRILLTLKADDMNKPAHSLITLYCCDSSRFRSGYNFNTFAEAKTFAERYPTERRHPILQTSSTVYDSLSTWQKNVCYDQFVRANVAMTETAPKMEIFAADDLSNVALSLFSDDEINAFFHSISGRENFPFRHTGTSLALRGDLKNPTTGEFLEFKTDSLAIELVVATPTKNQAFMRCSAKSVPPAGIFSVRGNPEAKVAWEIINDVATLKIETTEEPPKESKPGLTFSIK